MTFKKTTKNVTMGMGCRRTSRNRCMNVMEATVIYQKGAKTFLTGVSPLKVYPFQLKVLTNIKTVCQISLTHRWILSDTICIPYFLKVVIKYILSFTGF